MIDMFGIKTYYVKEDYQDNPVADDYGVLWGAFETERRAMNCIKKNGLQLVKIIEI